MKTWTTVLGVLLVVGTTEAVRPFLLGCQRCSRERVVDTGNSTSGGGRIVSERVRCRKCEVEFRIDLECLPPVAPEPGI